MQLLTSYTMKLEAENLQMLVKYVNSYISCSAVNTGLKLHNLQGVTICIYQILHQLYGHSYQCNYFKIQQFALFSITGFTKAVGNHIYKYLESKIFNSI